MKWGRNGGKIRREMQAMMDPSDNNNVIYRTFAYGYLNRNQYEYMAAYIVAVKENAPEDFDFYLRTNDPELQNLANGTKSSAIAEISNTTGQDEDVVRGIIDYTLEFVKFYFVNDISKRN